jgi:peptidoglycan/xylan/chitin deacetylase (PgdA/CDA1 family)
MDTRHGNRSLPRCGREWVHAAPTPTDSRRLVTRVPVWLLCSLALIAFAIATVAAPVRASASTVVSFTFDDTLANQYQARSVLAARTMEATFYVNSSRVNNGGYLTKKQLLGLQSDGNEIGGHTVNHLDLTTVDADEQKRQVCNDRSTLLGWGLEASSFAYPFGAETSELRQLVASCGYNAARDDRGISTAGQPAESLPPEDPFAIKTVDAIEASTTLTDLQAAVTRAEQAGGGWVTFVIHNVCDGCGTHAVSASTLGTFLDWLAPREAAGTTVKTIDEVIGGDLKPAVAGPAAPAVPSGNMVKNASLEADSDDNGFPDCWQPNSWQVNSSTWTRTSDARSGGYAERVDVTSYTSGAVRLLSQQDLGYCAPSARPGHSYKLRVWYKGSARPRLVGFFRNRIGAWNVLAQSSRLSRSTNWTRGLWTTPPLPSGATAIGIGVALESTGSLQMDDLAVHDAADKPG